MDSASDKIVCENIWKIFGDLPGNVAQIVQESEQEGLTKEDILKKHRITVGVQNANLSIKKGEIFVIMGLSGSGKSTLLRTFNRLIDPTYGHVFVDGEDVMTMRKSQLRSMCQEKMSMVFQHFGLLSNRNVIDNVVLGLEIRGVSKEKRRRLARDSVEMVGLSGWENSYPSELSGGMQQRVGLARALAGSPEILLMDEPFSALDPLIRRQLQDEFLQLEGMVGKTIVFITHDLDEGLKMGDHLAIMKDGVIVQTGTPEDIVMRPETDYVAEFVSAISRTRREIARNIMVDPDDWTCSIDDDPQKMLNRMRNEGDAGLFVTDDDDRILGVVNRETLRQGIVSGKTIRSLKDIMEQDYIVTDQNACIEDVLIQSSKTMVPLVVINKRKRLQGIIPRKILLKELADMV